MMDNIKLYIKLYEQQSFKKTAELLHMQASTLSRHIYELENELGNQLVIRTSKTFQPTDFGKYIYNKFKHIPDYIDYTLKTYHKIARHDQIHGKVNLVIGDTISYKLIAPKIRNFCDEYPNIHLNISFLSNISGWPAENINIVLAPIFIKGPNLINRFVRTEHVQLYCTSSYAARYGVPTKIEELTNHKFIGIVDDTFNALEYITIYNITSKQEHVLDLRDNFLNVNSGIYQYTIGNCSDYIFCCFNSFVEDSLRRGDIINVLPNWGFYELNFHIISRKFISAEEQLVIDFIYDCLKLN